VHINICLYLDFLKGFIKRRWIYEYTDNVSPNCRIRL
jgi:hypothetical protein